MTRLFLFSVILFSLNTTAGAVAYTPIGGTTPDTAIDRVPITASIKRISSESEPKSLKAEVLPRYAECANPPAIADIGGNFEVNRYVLTKTAAANLGLVAGIGKVSADTTSSQLLAIFDFSKSKDCLATDGKTRVIYGQSIRTITSFESADLKSNVTFPIVAAAATVSGKSSTISVKNLGFDDPTMGAKAVALSSMELSVENFSNFKVLYDELTALAAVQTSGKHIERLGIVPGVDEDQLIDTLPTAFAIQQIRDARACEDAKIKFKDVDDVGTKAITSTYVAITGTCSAAKPTADASAKAKDYLRGMKVSK